MYEKYLSEYENEIYNDFLQITQKYMDSIDIVLYDQIKWALFVYVYKKENHYLYPVHEERHLLKYYMESEEKIMKVIKNRRIAKILYDNAMIDYCMRFKDKLIFVRCKYLPVAAAAAAPRL